MRRTYRGWSTACLRHGLPYFPGLVNLCLRISQEVHVAISPGVHLGTLTAFESKGLIQDGEQVENGR